MAAGKIFKDIPRMLYMITIIEQYNNQMRLGAEEEIIYLHDKTNNILKLNDPIQIVEEFKSCVELINEFYYNIDPEWFKAMNDAEKLKAQIESERGY